MGLAVAATQCSVAFVSCVHVALPFQAVQLCHMLRPSPAGKRTSGKFALTWGSLAEVESDWRKPRACQCW